MGVRGGETTDDEDEAKEEEKEEVNKLFVSSPPTPSLPPKLCR